MMRAVLGMLFTVIAVSVGAPLPAPVAPAPKGFDGSAPWDGLEVEDCVAQLEAAGVQRYSFLKRPRVRVRKKWRDKPAMACHVPQAVHYKRGPTKVKYTSYTLLTCKMAIGLARFEVIAQEEAKKVFGIGLSKIEHWGTYNCRRIRGTGTASQHAYGNAIDIAAFKLKRAGWINVERHWNAKLPHKQKRRRFLHNLAKRLKEEQIFSVVLTPASNRGHKDHFHLDMMQREHPEAVAQ